jgi:hypothetical protein
MDAAPGAAQVLPVGRGDSCSPSRCGDARPPYQRTAGHSFHHADGRALTAPFTITAR